MAIGERIKHFLIGGTAEPPDAPRLGAGDRAALAKSLESLLSGERGWIAMADAQSLFSSASSQYAFGDDDEEGKSRIAAFAADHNASYDFMPVEGRVYFTRKAK
jgi:hypothetical protein